MNERIYYLGGFILLLLFGICSSTNIYTFNEKSTNINPFEKLNIIDKIYAYEVIPNTIKNDAVCALSDDKKRELCKIIFELPFYKTQLNIYLNKIPFFKTSLSCIEKDLVLLNLYETQHFLIGKQKVYPCYGRHENVLTSFIEDDYYATFYLSEGPSLGMNSVTIYSYIFDKHRTKLTVYDYVYNIDLSTLNSMFIYEKDVIKELKLIKNTQKIHVSYGEDSVSTVYDEEQKYEENDPICDLPYEKKITLCNIMYNQELYKNSLKITLNKSATYLLSMNCITKKVHDNTRNVLLQKQLRAKQRMFPCYGRHKIIKENNLLLDPHVKMLYLSHGSRRNSLFTYILVKGQNYSENYAVLEFVQNINITRLKPTIITREELMMESATTYERISKIIEHSENQYHLDLLNLIIESKSKGMATENQKFNRMVDAVEEEFSKVLEKLQSGNKEFEKLLSKHKKRELSSSESNTPKIKFQKTLSNRYILDNTMEHLLTQIDIFRIELKQKESTGIINFANFIQLGPQVYQRLLKKTQADMKFKNVDSHSKKGSSSFLDTTDNIQKLKDKVHVKNKSENSEHKRNYKLNSEVQRLIKNMEISIRESDLQKIQNLVEEISSIGVNANKESQEEKSKKKKKIKK